MLYMVKKEINNNLITAYALKNALEHSGKAREGSVLSSLFNEGLDKKDIKKVMPGIKKVVSRINKLKLDKQEQEYKKYEEEVSHRKIKKEGEIPELPNVDKKKGVIMRFAPAPSGALHVGHLISNIISSLYVKKYGGKFYVRIEDTNPDSIYENAYKEIIEDCDWAFGNVAEYIIQSDRLKIYYKYIEKLIKLGKAYVCICDQEDFRKLVSKKKSCLCRHQDVKENMRMWKKMLDKKGYGPGEAVVRFKSNIEDPNPAMRDFPLARINTHNHPRQKKKFRVWPLMNLCVTVDDLEYGMTHIIRGKDHMDNAARQKMIYIALGKEKQYPWVYFMGRVKFSDLALSKRKIKAAIEAGEYEGFDDIRLPTIQALRKRGYKPEAFWKFAAHRGLTDVDKVMTQKDFFEDLDKFNK